MDPQNLVIIMSDEHNPKVMAHAGHPIVQTPNLDRMASGGTRFTSAYTTSPVCIPARAGFACGKYIHQIGYWDNADAYDGSVPSWHHALRDRGHEVVSIGKLHFKLPDEDHGFTEEQIPMHIVEGKGDLMGLIRSELPRRGGAKKMAAMAGPGESTYTIYDRDICSRAQVWLRERALQQHDKPWVLFVSFVAPHFPLTAPPEHFYKYWNQDLPMPKLYDQALRVSHPYLEDYRNSFCYDDYFESPQDVKRALAGYYGLVSFLDEQIGKVLNVLDDTGLMGSTRVMYTSDHGDNLGTRGLWGKSTMYDETAAVPLIMYGAGIPAGKTVDTPASHVDCFTTILEATGEAEAVAQYDPSGVSLFDLAGGDQPNRIVLSEYHGMGSTVGAFAIRDGGFKYVYYAHPDYPSQLFDLSRDPEELVDLSTDPRYAALLKQCHDRLLALCDPDAVDAQAKMRQEQLLEENGGREAVIARGDLGFTPAPGTAADFR
jgi:choline-sulfatase